MDRRMGWYLWPQSEEDAKRSHEEGQRRWTMDIGHQETEQVLRRTERELKRIYLQAQTEAQQKLEDHFRKYEIKDRIKREALRKGEITEAEYAYWRKGQICIGQRWHDMVDTLTQDYVNADKIAMSTIYGHMPEAYAINHNYATFQVEQGSHIDTSYTLYDRSTVERLVRDNPELLPKPRVDIPKDKRWNRAHIRDAITQGIVQGEDLRKVAHRLQKVTDMDYRAALRNARTSVTGAQNAGRVEAYHRAEKMGIELEQEWLATLDGRTRHSHRQMDGKRVKIGEKFDNGCMYPGDPSGPPEEVYNCRCTLVPVVKGIDQSDAPRNDKLGGMSYEEWKNEHYPHAPMSITSVKVPNTTPAVPSNAVSAELFVPTLDAAKASCPDDKAWRVDTTRTAEDFRADRITTYITPGGSTFALKDDGDIISVCKNQLTDADTNARSLLAAAVEAGGTHLDSFDGNYGFYVRCGFEPVSRCKFSVEYAPPGWVQGRDKEEDIYFMRYVGVGKVKYTSIEDARLHIPYSESYDDAEAVIKALVKGGKP